MPGLKIPIKCPKCGLHKHTDVQVIPANSTTVSCPRCNVTFRLDETALMLVSKAYPVKSSRRYEIWLSIGYAISYFWYFLMDATRLAGDGATRAVTPGMLFTALSPFAVCFLATVRLAPIFGAIAAVVGAYMMWAAWSNDHQAKLLQPVFHWEEWLPIGMWWFIVVYWVLVITSALRSRWYVTKKNKKGRVEHC